MRRFYSLIVPVLALTLAGCKDDGSVSPQYQAPAAFDIILDDSQLQDLNNQIVACAQSNELDSQTASRLALIVSILRFTPMNDAKTEALLQALQLQVEHANGISAACQSQLNGTLESLLLQV
jgi:hypothetical protein